MKKALAATLLFSAFSLPALAQLHQGQYWYGALDFGQLTMGNSKFSNPGAMSASAGLRLNRNLAMEGGVNLIGDATDGANTVQQRDLRFTALGILPMGPSAELFGKAGIALHTATVNTASPYTTNNVIYGFGAQFNVGPKFGLRVQYEILGKAKSNAADPGADISRFTIGGVGRF